MAAERLKNAPLVEAIVELRWKPIAPEGMPPFDPNYSLLLGRLSEVMKDEYPVHEATPNARAPAEMAAQFHMVQHRFRSAKDGWPLIQVGPTVFTINETEAYDWEADFRQRVIRAIERFFQAYQQHEQMEVESVLLRYIDGIEFDWEEQSLFDFLKEGLKTRMDLPLSLFQDTGVGGSAVGLDFRCAFACSQPKGMAHLRLASGQARAKNAVIMETMVQSLGGDVPHLPEGFGAWLDAAHEIPSTWFRRLTSGDLYRRFENG